MPVVNVARLETEIKGSRNNLLSHMSVRAQHPTYGITKKILWADFYELQGMVFSWLYLMGKWEHSGRISLTEELNDTIMLFLSVDLLKYHDQITESK